jgi:type I restriction enzyme S subunit
MFDGLRKAGVPIVSLSSLTEDPQYGFTASAASEPVGPKLVRITDLQDGRIKWETVPYCECPEPTKYLLKAGDILFARTGATTGKTHLVESDADAVFASYPIRVRPRSGVRGDYLYYFFQSDFYWSQIVSEKEGSAQPNVNGRKLMNILLPSTDTVLQGQIVEFLKAVRERQDGLETELPLLPSPLEEQRRIVERIERLAQRVTMLSETQESVRQETDLLLQAGRAKLFEGMAKSGTVLLCEAAVLERGKFSHRPRNDPRFFGGAHPWIQIGEIEASGKYIEQWTETLNDDGLAISKKFPKGTLLISIAATIGAVGILRFDCCVPDSIVGVTPKPGWDSTYLFHYLCYLRDHLEQVAPQSAQKNINLQILSGLPVPVATPKGQAEAVAYLDALEEMVRRLRKLQTAGCAETHLLMPSVLNAAFSGQL